MDDSLSRFLVDELGPLGPVSVRRMFGGGGVFIDGSMLALISDDRLYFKVDDALRPRFEAAGLHPFVYERKTGKPVVMSFWQAPEDVFDDPDALRDWASAALAAARRAQKKAPRRAKARAARR